MTSLVKIPLRSLHKPAYNNKHLTIKKTKLKEKKKHIYFYTHLFRNAFVFICRRPGTLDHKNTGENRSDASNSL